MDNRKFSSLLFVICVFFLLRTGLSWVYHVEIRMKLDKITIKVDQLLPTTVTQGHQYSAEMISPKVTPMPEPNPNLVKFQKGLAQVNAALDVTTASRINLPVAQTVRGWHPQEGKPVHTEGGDYLIPFHQWDASIGWAHCSRQVFEGAANDVQQASLTAGREHVQRPGVDQWLSVLIEDNNVGEARVYVVRDLRWRDPE